MTGAAAKLRAALRLVAGFLWDLAASTWSVARIVLMRRVATRPAIVEMPTRLEQPWAVAMLAYFLSVTPGSTCLHVSDDRRRLYVHFLDAPDPDAAILRMRRLYEDPIAELER